MLILFQTQINNNPLIYVRCIMENRVEDYFETEEESEAGHVDTRFKNFECDEPDPHLGCDPGVDVQG